MGLGDEGGSEYRRRPAGSLASANNAIDRLNVPEGLREALNFTGAGNASRHQ